MATWQGDKPSGYTILADSVVDAHKTANKMQAAIAYKFDSISATVSSRKLTIKLLIWCASDFSYSLYANNSPKDGQSWISLDGGAHVLQPWDTHPGYSSTWGTGTWAGHTYDEVITTEKTFTQAQLVSDKNVAVNGWVAFLASWNNTGQQYDKVANKDISGTITVPKIANASTVSISGNTIGSEATISISRTNSSYTDTLTYSFGKLTGTIVTKTSTTSVKWTIPANLATAITSTTTGKGTITCKTYNGTTEIGTKSIEFTANVPASYKPTVTGLTLSEVATLPTAFRGKWIQNVSKIKVNTAASGSYGSNITSYSVSVDGGGSGNSAEWTSNTLSKNGQIKISATVTDSRGRTSNAYEQTITVVPYFAPAIASFNVKRANANGAENEDGEYCKVIVVYTVAPVDNANSYAIQVKDNNGVVVTSKEASSTEFSSTYTATSTVVYDVGKSYSMTVTIKDLINTVGISSGSTLATAYYIMHWNENGNGIALGKVSEKAGFEVNMPQYNYENLTVMKDHPVIMAQDKDINGNLIQLSMRTSDDKKHHGLRSNGYLDDNNAWHSDGIWIIRRNAAGIIVVEKALTVQDDLKAYGNIRSNSNGSAGVVLSAGGIELYHNTTPYIDFHYGNSTSDYTSRIWESSSGNIQVIGTFSTSKTADLNALKINGTSVSDFVSSAGTSNGWTYIRWNSGRYECWRTLNFNSVDCSTFWGNQYTTSGTWGGNTNIAFPVTFNDVPTINVSMSSDNASITAYQQGGSSTKPTTTKTGVWFPGRPSAITITNLKVHYHVCGTV